MALQKTYSRINWENYPSENTPLNETNLNRIDYATDEIDNRVIALDTEKLDKESAYGLISSVTLDNQTGVLKIRYLNGTETTYQTVLNKVAVNFAFNPTTQKMVITNEDGTTEEVDLSAFVTQFEFVNSPTVVFSINNGQVSARIPNGAITGDMLRPNYLADILVAQAAAETAQSDAEARALESQSWAVGGTGTRLDEDTDNSKYYSSMSESAASQAAEIKDQAQELLNSAIEKVAGARFYVDFETGDLWVETDSYDFSIDYSTGFLQMEVSA